MRTLWLSTSVIFLIAATVFCVSAQTYSELWGKNGENWSPQSRLPDVSYAGYHNGEQPIPDNLPIAASVKDFGAVGDGEHDDSQAFLDAIKHVEKGAIFVPDGTYKITQILEIEKPGIALIGESRDGTVLYFPTPLNKIRPNWGATTSGRRTSNYSWSGGFVWLKGSFRSETLAQITQPAERGDKWITVDSTETLEPGQWVEVRQDDNEDNSLAAHLYTGQPGNTENLNGRATTTLTTRITEIEGNRVRLQRALRVDLQKRWNPRVRRFAPTVQEVGIENLTFRFPVTPYEGHFTELGNNAIAFSHVANCWVRHVRIQNPDSGLFISGRFCTLTGVRIDSERKPDSRNDTGHHGIHFGGDDNLFTNFDFRTGFIHDLGVSRCAGNVYSNGHGENLSFDHHKYAPYANVYTNIDVGRGTEVWRCGGGRALGKHCAGYGTFWNLRAQTPIGYPPGDFGPDTMNIVGLTTDREPITEMQGKWFEVIAPEQLRPQNIHEAQLQKRLRKQSQ